MGRPRKPIEHHILTGAVRKDPQRYRKAVPKSTKPLGDPPEYMEADAKAAWHEIASMALPGVLTGADRFMVEIAANELAAFRRNPSKFRSGRFRVLRTALSKLALNAPFDPLATKPEKSND